MRATFLHLVPVIVLPLSLACGGSGATHGEGGAGTSASTTEAASTGTGMGGTSVAASSVVASSVAATTSTSTGMTGGIPDPGTSDMVNCNFGDVEPNNTPQEATPLGTAMAGDLGVWVNGNDIGGAGNPADYFVFRSGSPAGTFSFDICFGAPITSMTATLWKVAGGAEVTPPVGTWTAASGCVTDMTAPAALDASTVYLFGLTAEGGAGSYGA